MAKFAYNMQSVLNIKYKLENQEKIAYANAQAELRRQEERLEGFQKRRQYFESQMREHLEKTVDVKSLYECNRGMELMKEAIHDQKKEVKIAQEGVDRAQERLNEAMKERKTHEKLKENAFEEFVQELNAKESKEIDELVSYTYASSR